MQFFLCKKQLNDGNHGQGAHSAKMGADSLAENNPNISKKSRLICPIGPNLWNIVEKRLHQTSVIRGCKERKIAKKKERLLQRKRKASWACLDFFHSCAPLIHNFTIPQVKCTNFKNGCFAGKQIRSRQYIFCCK